MKITKFGHCCLLIEEKGLRILTDPGMYSTQQNSIKGIDVILITHDHQDHLHIDSLKEVLKNNPNAQVVTNRTVGAILEKESVTFTLIENNQSTTIKDVLFEGFGEHHAFMHPTIPQIQNVGYLIANRLFYPGDAFTDPGKPVDILALPVAGPWMKLSEAIDYALKLRPSVCFPVHEGILKSPGSTHRIPAQVLEPQGIVFKILEIDKEVEI